MTGIHVRLPRSPNTHGLAYAILISRICPRRSLGDAFEGRCLKPGATLPEGELWPDANCPQTPLLLEYAGSDRTGSGHKRSHHLYILWRYDRAAQEWEEIARASATGLEWVDDLRRVAMRHLASTRTPDPAAVADATSRVLGLLESELETLDTEDRRRLLGFLYEQFTARLVRDGVADAGAL